MVVRLERPSLFAILRKVFKFSQLIIRKPLITNNLTYFHVYSLLNLTTYFSISAEVVCSSVILTEKLYCKGKAA